MFRPLIPLEVVGSNPSRGEYENRHLARPRIGGTLALEDVNRSQSSETHRAVDAELRARFPNHKYHSRLGATGSVQLGNCYINCQPMIHLNCDRMHDAPISPEEFQEKVKTKVREHYATSGKPMLLAYLGSKIEKDNAWPFDRGQRNLKQLHL
jgi:hypothetical protein